LDIRSVVFHRPAYAPNEFPRDGRTQFAIVGRSNVGKSTLINSIFRRKDLARVSQTPGKTQAIHFYLVNEKFFVVDLPGYGYAKVSKTIKASWAQLIADYFEHSEGLHLVFLLLDFRRIPSDDDRAMLGWIRQAGVDYRIVLTKADKLSNNQRVKARRDIRAALEEIDPEKMIEFSKMTREGVDKLWRVIEHELKDAVDRRSIAE
jgi:GTP-binding protein